MLSTTNVVYAKEAIATGRLLFERDRRVTARFAMLALSMYASLQEARREVLRTYAACRHPAEQSRDHRALRPADARGIFGVPASRDEDIDMSVLRWIVESGHRDWIRLGEALGVSIRP